MQKLDNGTGMIRTYQDLNGGIVTYVTWLSGFPVGHDPQTGNLKRDNHMMGSSPLSFLRKPIWKQDVRMLHVGKQQFTQKKPTKIYPHVGKHSIEQKNGIWHRPPESRSISWKPSEASAFCWGQQKPCGFRNISTTTAYKNAPCYLSWGIYLAHSITSWQTDITRKIAIFIIYG